MKQNTNLGLGNVSGKVLNTQCIIIENGKALIILNSSKKISYSKALGFSKQ